MNKNDKPFIMSKKDKKIPPKKDEKEVLDLDELLVDSSNKTMILDLSELEFDSDYNSDEIDDEKTEDISSRFRNIHGNTKNLVIDEKPELDLDDLLEERTMEHLESLDKSNEKTVVISIEDIIETSSIGKNDSFIKNDDIFEETFNSLKKTTGNTFIKNIDKKILDGLVNVNEVKAKEYSFIDNNKAESIEESSEKLLDFLIYGKLDQFETELDLLQKSFDNNIIDLIKYMFEFYVKKDD